MKLTRLLNSEKICLSLSAENKEVAICELVKCLSELEGFSSETHLQLEESFLEREKEFSTGIGNRVAIPHAFSDQISEPVAVLGLSQDGIEFDSFDGVPVNLIILFVSPKGEYQQHLHVLAAIGKSLRDQAVVSSICEAETTEMVIKALQK